MIAQLSKIHLFFAFYCFIKTFCGVVILHYRSDNKPSLLALSLGDKNMGGVDHCNMLLSLFTVIPRRARNGRIFISENNSKKITFHLLDLCIVNTWTLFTVVKSS